MVVHMPLLTTYTCFDEVQKLSIRNTKKYNKPKLMEGPFKRRRQLVQLNRGKK